MTIHRFVHIGDTHVQSSHPRNQDRLDALDQIIAFGESHEVSAWIYPGDLYHTKSTPEDRNAMVERIRRLATWAPVVVVQGNHDAPGDLDVFGRLATVHGVHVVTTPEVITIATTTGHANIACLPYPNRGGLVAAGISHDLLGQEAKAPLEAIFRMLADKLAQDRHPDSPELFIGHVNVAGAVMSTGQPSIGQEIELDERLLQLFGPIPKLLNHVHRAQELGGAIYAGSICRLDFGEQEIKGFNVVEYDGTRQPGQLADWLQWSWQFVPLKVPAQLHVEGRLTRDGFLCDPIDPFLIGGADIRVQYTFKKAEVGVLDVGHIHRAFEGCRSLKLDPIPELEHSIRAPELLTAQTIPEKVAVYAASQGLAWGACLESKLQLLLDPHADAVATVTTCAAEAGREPELR